VPDLSATTPKKYETHWVILLHLTNGSKRYLKERWSTEYRGDFTALRSNARRFESKPAALHVAYELKLRDRMVVDFEIESFNVV
jgi:hypothetical protein